MPAISTNFRGHVRSALSRFRHCRGRWRNGRSLRDNLWRRRVIPRTEAMPEGIHPNAAAPATPAPVIQRTRVRFLMRLPLLGACAHLERDVHLTHRSVDSAWLRRSFKAVREQVGLQGE
jgi:hypothetical protein